MSLSLHAAVPAAEDETDIEETVARIESAAQNEAASSQGVDADAAPQEMEAVDAVTLRAAYCEIHIGTLTRSGKTLTGRGSQANCGGYGPPLRTDAISDALARNGCP